MNQDSRDKLQQREQKIQERERAIRLRELEAEIYEQDQAKEPPLYATQKHAPP